MEWSYELFKEFRMQSVEENKETEISKKVSLADLSKLTGFPAEMIEKELFLNQAGNEELSLEDLRMAMLNFIDNTLLDEKTAK
jgi:hypothetical protein